MKTVFYRSSEVAHRWANQTQAYGRSGNVSFQGRKFFSYQTCVAELVENSSGRLVAIFDCAKYSISTTRHIGEARFAANHIESYGIHRGVFNQQDCTPCQKDVETFLDRITTQLGQAGRSAKWHRYDNLLSVQSGLYALTDFCKIFGLKEPEIPASILSELTAKKLRAAQREQAVAKLEKENREAQRMEARRAAESIQRAERAKELAGVLTAWRDGSDIHAGLYNCPVALRLDSKGTHVETSHGASVGLPSAARLFLLCCSVKAKGKPYTVPNTQRAVRVGPYTLSLIDKYGNARVGCHTLHFEEMSRLAEKIGANRLRKAARMKDDEETA